MAAAGCGQDGAQGATTAAKDGQGAETVSLDALSHDAADSEVAPAAVPKFQRTFGGEWDEEGRAIALAADGDLLVAGYTNTHGAGDWDGLLLRTDSCGVPRWARAYGGVGQDVLVGVTELTGGGLAAAGQRSAVGGQPNVWVMRTDATGALQWSKTYGGGGHDAGVALAETDDEATVVLGETYNFGPGTPKYHNLMMLSVDAKGALLWDRTFGGDLEGDAGFALDIQRDKAGKTASIVIAGATESYGQGRDDVWLLVLDPQGKVQWSKAYGGSEDDEARGIAPLAGGGWAITGFTRGFGAKSADIFAMQVDAKGAVQWWHRYGGGGKDRGYNIHPLPAADGAGFLVTGYTQSFGHAAGYDDRFVLRLDKQGGPERLVTIGGKGDDQAVASVVSGDGGVVLAGRTNSFGHGLRDVWLVKSDGQGNALCNLQVQTSAALNHADKDVEVVSVLPGEATGAVASDAPVTTTVIETPGKLTTTACAAICP